MAKLKMSPFGFVVREASHQDEVRFNQLHNGALCEVTRCSIRVDGLTPGLNSVVDSERIVLSLPCEGASGREQVCYLIAKYGPFYGCVCSRAGDVIVGAEYAAASRIMRTPLNVFVVDDEDKARGFLLRGYGKFSYAKIERVPSVQTYAQLKRARNGTSRAITPAYKWLHSSGAPFRNMLDFGSGQGDCARIFGAHEWEPFRRVGSTDRFDVSWIEERALALGEYLHDSGRFDVVLADYVLNSVQDDRAHRDVLVTAASLCKVGGLVVLSGRRGEFVDRLERRYKSRASRTGGRSIEFRDASGFSALWRKGAWFFQRFHYEPEVMSLASGIGTVHHYSHTEAEWMVAIRKLSDVPNWEESVEREFSLIGADGVAMPYGKQIVRSLEEAIANERS